MGIHKQQHCNSYTLPMVRLVDTLYKEFSIKKYQYKDIVYNKKFINYIKDIQCSIYVNDNCKTIQKKA